MSQLSGKQLEKAMFPIGGMQKSEVREIAKRQAWQRLTKKIQRVFVLLAKETSANFLVNFACKTRQNDDL